MAERDDEIIVRMCGAYNQVLFNQPEDQRDGHAAMRAALAVVREAEGDGWMRAPDTPEHMEGMLAWEWAPGYKVPRLSRIPRGYSREPSHSGGFWFKLASLPAPPEGDA